MATIPISLGPAGPSPDPSGAGPGDKITWTNNTGQIITSFSLPSCVSPKKSPAPIPVGKTTDPYNVNSGTPNGKYPYSYSQGAAKDTKNGTIDVGNR
jgi:hypothetical protein